MRVGISLAASFPVHRMQTLVEMAERVGAAGVWLPDHLLGSFHPALIADSPIGDAVNQHGRLRRSVLRCGRHRNLDRPADRHRGDRLDPTGRARCRSIDVDQYQICPGGFNIGIGSGEAENLVPFKYPFDRPVARCERCPVRLRADLDGTPPPGGRRGRIGASRTTAAGAHRVWVAGHGPRMLRLTGQYVDGWLRAWAMSPDAYAEKLRPIAARGVTAGRSVAEAGLLCFGRAGIELGRFERLCSALVNDVLGARGTASGAIR